MSRRRRHIRTFIAVDVVKLGLSSLLGLAHAHRFPRHQLRCFTCGVAQISRNDSVFRAHDHASWFQPNFSAMRAEMALGGRTIVRIHIYRIVRTSLHAGFAANAAIGIKIDNPVLALIHRRHGTDGDARRLLAMVAARDLKYAARVGERALLDVLDPSPVHAYRHLVLGFAGHGAGVTSDALAVIDYEAVFHPRGLDPKQSIILVSARIGSNLLGRVLNSLTTEDTRVHEGEIPERFLRRPSCPLWLTL